MLHPELPHWGEAFHHGYGNQKGKTRGKGLGGMPNVNINVMRSGGGEGKFWARDQREARVTIALYQRTLQSHLGKLGKQKRVSQMIKGWNTLLLQGITGGGGVVFRHKLDTLPLSLQCVGESDNGQEDHGGWERYLPIVLSNHKMEEADRKTHCL